MSEFKINMKTKVSLWLAAVLVVSAFAGGVWAGGATTPDNQVGIIKGASLSATSTDGNSGTLLNSQGEVPSYLTKDVDFSMFWDVWNIVKDNYYDKNVPDTQLFYGALAGIVDSLKDPYSVFMTPQDSSDFQSDLQGSFEGIGAEIAVKDSQLTIVSPLPDSPAIKAGLKPKDLVLAINGTSTQDMRLDQAVNLIRGSKGSTVVLSVFRDGFEAPRDFSIVRDSIVVKSVSLEYRNNVAYVKVRQFNDDTVPLFDAALDEIGKRTTKGIIIDLRNNPGGYLQSAVDMVGEWVGDKTAVIEKRRDGSEVRHASTRVARIGDMATTVLVDGGSASASEILAGALQDYGKATLIGTKTFGKGSVQDLVSLGDGSAIKITVAKWFTPDGRSIDETGIEPDVKVELSEEDFAADRDPQLDRAMESFK